MTGFSDFLKLCIHLFFCFALNGVEEFEDDGFENICKSVCENKKCKQPEAGAEIFVNGKKSCFDPELDDVDKLKGFRTFECSGGDLLLNDVLKTCFVSRGICDPYEDVGDYHILCICDGGIDPAGNDALNGFNSFAGLPFKIVIVFNIKVRG